MEAARRRHFPLRPLLLGLFVAGCAGAAPPQPGSGGSPPDSAAARFAPGAEADVIQVRVTDRRAVRDVTLVGPGGIAQPAFTLQTGGAAHAYEPRTTAPSVDMRLGGSRSGSETAFPPGGGSVSLYGGQIASFAEIRLPDPVLYRQTWRDWRVRIRLGDPPDAATVDLPAPRPSPG
ncbi:MAG TPA: hypothetical protein VGD08_07630 [Stellaceae bacterium]